MAIDYFTKWVEAISFANLTKTRVSRFIKNNISYIACLITDNAKNLYSDIMDALCTQFKIHPQKFNFLQTKDEWSIGGSKQKNITKILQKMTGAYRDWHEKLPFSLLVYRTSILSSPWATPFFLVYRMEAVPPIEVEILVVTNLGGNQA